MKKEFRWMIEGGVSIKCVCNAYYNIGEGIDISDEDSNEVPIKCWKCGREYVVKVDVEEKIVSKWLDYPENYPPPTEGFKWYKVLMKDGNIYSGCWWTTHWYCFSDWWNIIKFRELDEGEKE